MCLEFKCFLMNLWCSSAQGPQRHRICVRCRSSIGRRRGLWSMIWFFFFFKYIYIYRKLLYRIGTIISQMQTFCFATIVSNLCDCQEEKEVTFDVSPKALAAVALGFVDVSLDVDLKQWQSFGITLFVPYHLQGHARTWWRRESEGAHAFHFGSG